MIDLIRDSTVGQLINNLSHGRLLPYADQRADYVVPERYRHLSAQIPRTDTTLDDINHLTEPTPEKGLSSDEKGLSSHDTSRLPTRPASPSPEAVTSSQASAQTLVRDADISATAIEKTTDVEKGESPAETFKNNTAVADPELEVKTNPFLVDWDGPNDPDNPRNWSLPKRCFVACSISVLTFSVYIGSAIYTSSIPSLREDFGVSQVKAALGLTLYIMGYGIGPMFLTPLQELASLGRNPVYIITLAIFVLFNVPIVTAKNFSTILAFRFWTGFMASPALATGGATLGDIFPPHRLPYAIGIWGLSAVAGPVTGPVIGGFAAQANGWRWPIYELIWISGFALIWLIILLPETLEANILLKRAQRLRKLTGNPNLRSQSEIDQASLSRTEVAYESLVRPFVLAAEPAVLFANIYLGLVYSVFYLWFEAFPLVFNDMYHMSLGIGSLPFLGFTVSGAVAYTTYALYLRYHLDPRHQKYGPLPPEARLEIGLMASIFIPTSLFMFGWTSRKSINWIAPVIAGALYLPGIFLSFQSILMYLALSYTNYQGSILAGNNLFRSVMASIFPLFGNVFFRNLGVGPGSSMLAGISIFLILVYSLLVKYGDRLRARSRYATA